MNLKFNLHEDTSRWKGDGDIMLVECVINDLKKLSNLDSVVRLQASIHLDGEDQSLQVGKQYIVDAIAK